ncbi:MAG TPA: hypothetical protein VER33_15740, partial [Polyangiaceae bacterium]|nr:hypothetical protein [Polyangiaceae bacterium]
MSLYALDFSRADGSRVLALWTLRGRRSIELGLAPGSSASWRLTDAQGNSSTLRARADSLALSVGTGPVYLEGRGRVTGGQGGPPDHRDAVPAQAALVSALDSLHDWVVEDQRDMNLEFHNALTPRRKGELEVRRVSELEGRTGALCVALRAGAGGPDTMPLYGALRHRRGIPLPGRPTALAILVNGNSSFGRVIFELEDASRQRWTSIGASGSAVLSSQLLALIPPEFAAYKRRARLADWNTDDVFGVSRINFDGWRHVSFPLPGNYPGEGYGWPANSQWMHDGDGRVHYPLKLRRLIVELPQKTLHVTAYLPAPRPEIYLSELLVEQGDPEWRAPLGSGAQPRKTLQ